MCSLFECDGGGETLANQALPRGDVGNSAYNNNVKAGADDERHGDGLEEIGRREAWMRFFRRLGDGFETGDEIRNDLQGEQDGHQGRVTKQGLEVSGSTAAGADDYHGHEHKQDGGGGPVLEGCARVNATIVQIAEKKRQSQTEKQPWKKYGHAGDAVEFDGVELGKKVG